MAGLCDRSSGEDVDDGVVVTSAIKVNQARQLFGVKGDAILAHNLQDKEFEAKYNWNREVRRTARTDVPLAKATYDEQEEMQQRERLQFLQDQTRLAEEDAELARKYDREEQLAKQRDRLKQEALDQEMANRIRVMEIQEQGRPKVSRSRDDDRNERAGDHPLGGSVIRMSSFAGFHLDPSSAGGSDGLTEEERRQLMMMQDEELALALQEHEQMRALRIERSRVVERSTATDGHVSQHGYVRVVGHSPPISDQYQTRSPPPAQPTRQAPRIPAQYVNTDDQYARPNRSRTPNDVTDRSLTLVTSVGNSEFFRALPAAEAPSTAQPKTTRLTAASTNRNNSSAEMNRTNSAQTNRKTSNQDPTGKSNARK